MKQQQQQCHQTCTWCYSRMSCVFQSWGLEHGWDQGGLLQSLHVSELIRTAALFWGREGILGPCQAWWGRLRVELVKCPLPAVTTSCPPWVGADSKSRVQQAHKMRVEKLKCWSYALVELTLTFPSGREKKCKVPSLRLMVSYPCCEKLWVTAQNVWWWSAKHGVCSGFCHSGGLLTEALLCASLGEVQCALLAALPWVCGTLMLWTVAWVGYRSKSTF